MPKKKDSQNKQNQGSQLIGLKVFLDDDYENRPTPEGWIRARWPNEVIEYLKTGNVEEISLDHDLADKSIQEITGYDVLEWIEKEVYLNKFKPPKISIHTSNPSARKKMELAKNSIERLWIMVKDK